MDNKIIGEFLLSLRKERSLTQSDIANLCNVSGQAVSKWERGESIPDIGILQKLSLLYNITINELLDGVRKSTNENDINKIFYLKIILLLISLLAFFLPFVSNGVILRGFKLIYSGLSGYTVYITWLMFISIISQIIYFSFVSTGILKKNICYRIFTVISSSLLFAMSLINIAVIDFVPISQFIIGMCAVGLLTMLSWETKDLDDDENMEENQEKLLRKHKSYFDICMTICSVLFIVTLADLVVNYYVDIEEYLVPALLAFMVLSYFFTRTLILSKSIKTITRLHFSLLSVPLIFILLVASIRFIQGYYKPLPAKIAVLMVLIVASLPLVFPILNLRSLNKVTENKLSN